MTSPEINVEQEKSRVRETVPYKRLKAKFADGELDVRVGLESSALTLGDLLDIALLYFECRQLYVGVAAIPSLRDAARVAIDGISFSPKTKKEIDQEITNLHGGNDLRDLQRELNPLYSLTVDLERLPFKQFEVIHHPMVLIDRIPYKGNHPYILIVGKRDHLDRFEPYITTLYEETGLPIQSDAREEK